MAWHKPWHECRTNFQDCNGGIDFDNGPGVTGVLIILMSIILCFFGGILGAASTADYLNKKSYWECAANTKKCDMSRKMNDKAVYLNKLLFATNEDAANKLGHLLAPKKETDRVKRWTKEKLISETKAGMDRGFVVGAACSNGANLGFACDGTDLVRKLLNKQKVEVSPTVPIVAFSVAGGFYLFVGFVLMGRFIANFGRPSGGLIFWMCFFAPIFIPFWMVIGAGGAAVLGLQGLASANEKRKERKSKLEKQKELERKKQEEEEIVGRDVVKQRQKISELTARAEKIKDNETREKQLSRLRQTQTLVEDEAKMRIEQHRKALKEALGETEGIMNLEAEIDDVLFEAEAHREARDLTRK